LEVWSDVKCFVEKEWGRPGGRSQWFMHSAFFDGAGRESLGIFFYSVGRGLCFSLSGLSNQFKWRRIRTIGCSLHHWSRWFLHHARRDGSPLPKISCSDGTLLSDPLKDIWERSEIFGKLSKKENLKGKCGRCEIEDCRGCRSLALALTGDFFEENPHCWYNPSVPSD